MHHFFAVLALISLGLVLWQWAVAWRFPLHRRAAAAAALPAVTLLKPLKGLDAETAACLESWLRQDYPGAVQILFGVASAADPVCELVRKLLTHHPARDAQLVVCPEVLGPNAKVSTLIQLERRIQHEVVVISDADVRVPPDLLRQVAAPLHDSAVGLINCFYRLANPSTLAMRWEAVAINADFWSQVLQSRSLKPLDFALGAVMATTRSHLERMGGFAPLVGYLADDYQFGQRLAQAGARIELCPVVVECWSAPLGWRAVWAHQLRWARTIRVCQPAPYFFSILGNATLWPLLWLLCDPHVGVRAWLNLATDGSGRTAWLWEKPHWASVGFALCVAVRVLTALHLEARLTRSTRHLPFGWLVPVKDLLQFLIWAQSFVGNRVRWRGEVLQVRRGGRMTGA